MSLDIGIYPLLLLQLYCEFKLRQSFLLEKQVKKTIDKSNVLLVRTGF